MGRKESNQPTITQKLSQLDISFDLPKQVLIEEIITILHSASYYAKG